jgi:serine phosphatase RsbU (regulator of sigma subunit)/anti-sigma regulatory factor (Ser/Thr protein kinase)
MTAFIQSLKRILIGNDEVERSNTLSDSTKPVRRIVSAPVDILPNDPIVAYFQSSPGAVEIEQLNLASPALDTLKQAGVKLVIPLVSQGEMIGLLNLGPRLSEQEYSADDRKLLNDLAAQAAPAVRVAQLVRQQQAEARQRERIEQELQVARIIQQTLLPKELPELTGWKISAYYQPAREVGGDFYDFINYPDGRLGLVVGDVTDKGIPAAMVMATTRSTLRTIAENSDSPGKVLQLTNEKLYPDIPPNMFITCLYAVLDPLSGRMRFANAGHNLPYRYSKEGVDEIRATGMPLGLMPGIEYEEKEIILEPGQCLLFLSDGLIEAHNQDREMFGFSRMKNMMIHDAGNPALIDHLLMELEKFTGKDWEQEDDVTLLTLVRQDPKEDGRNVSRQAASTHEKENNLQTITEFSLPSLPGNERKAMESVVEAVQDLNLSSTQLERLKTGVAEATMNAMEHGNKYDPDLPVTIKVRASQRFLSIQVIDFGKEQPIPEVETPDLDAKLEGSQSPRGWGLFLIKNMVDEINVSSDEIHHTIELIMNLEGGDHEHTTSEPVA